MTRGTFTGFCAVLFGVLASCNQPPTAEPSAPPLPAPTEKRVDPGPVLIDGSSTVFPISRSVLSLYADQVTAEIKVAFSGTGAGIKKFCNREIAIAGASRPISADESKLCEYAKVEFIELPVAFDGIAVVVSKDNDWASNTSVKELKKLWQPSAEGKVMKWSDVRPGWPDRPIDLNGPGKESGTFDYFTATIMGEEGASRGDYRASEDDEQIVDHVAKSKDALGYFGFAYYARNKDKLKVLAVDDGVAENGKGNVAPSPVTIADAKYQPLARPLFIYVSVEAAKRKEVNAFVKFYLRAARIVAADVGCVSLPDSLFDLARKRFVEMRTGSVFQGLRSTVGLTIEDLMAAETTEVVHTKTKDG
jgi:phosphate transport system substrate-binding protein